MKKVWILCLCIYISASSLFAVTLTKDWIMNDYVQPVNYDLNCMAYDPVSGYIVNSNFGTDLSLEMYDSSTGAFIKSSKLSGLTFGTLGGFSVAFSSSGNAYLTDSAKVYKIDSIDDTTVIAVHGTNLYENPTRNMSIQGTGENTYMAGTGSADNGPVQIWKSNNAECTLFSPWKTVSGASLNPIGAGKSGCAIYQPNPTQPPLWVAGSEVFGAQYLRVFKYNTFSGNYDHAFTVGGTTENPFPCFDMAFDFTEGYIPIVAALTTTGYANPNLPVANGFNVEAMLEVFNMDPSTGVLTSVATYDFTDELNKIGNRGSLEIDPVNKKIYVSFRCEGGTNHVAMAKISYTLDTINPNPTPTPIPSITPTPSPTPIATKTPITLVAEGYEKPKRGLAGQKILVSQSHGLLFNDETLQWGWQRPLIQGTREDLLTPMFCNRWFLRYLQNAGAETYTARERDEQTSETIVNFNLLTDVSEKTGTWNEYTDSSAYDGAALIAPSNPSDSKNASVTFRTDVPKSGFFCLYIRHPQHPNAAEFVPYIVTDGAGNQHHYRINQTQQTGIWNYLDRFYFEAGKDKKILEINDAGTSEGKVILADAVRIGGGMGSIDWGHGISGVPRWHESSKSYARYIGAPDYTWNFYTTSSDYGVRTQLRYLQTPGQLYFEIHSNASAGSGTASGSFAYVYGRDDTDKNKINQLYIKTCATIQEDWDITWLRRAPDLIVDSYYSPMILLELAFHDNLTQDLIYLMDPDFRHIMARGLYCGAVDYFTNNTGVYLPETPFAPYTEALTTDTVKIGWMPPIFGTPPDKYRVYYSNNPFSFPDYLTVAHPAQSVIMNTVPGQLYYFAIRSENAGGISLPTEVLAARTQLIDGKTLLMVNGFDRLDWQVQEGDNTRNFVIQHALAVIDAETTTGINFALSSASNEAIAYNQTDLKNYEIVDWISGEESRRYDVTYGKGYTDDKTFTSAEQDKIKDYLKNSGKLFISGSDIAWDLAQKGNEDDKDFLNNYLHAAYVEDNSNIFAAEGSSGTFLNKSCFFDDGKFEVYRLLAPDTISPFSGASAIMTYQSSFKICGIKYITEGQRLVLFSFPFETIVGKTNRADFMAAVIQTLLETPSVSNPNIWFNH